eukprot:13840350-Ditylum_brightwellii.AAC.1
MVFLGLPRKRVFAENFENFFITATMLEHVPLNQHILLNSTPSLWNIGFGESMHNLCWMYISKEKTSTSILVGLVENCNNM